MAGSGPRAKQKSGEKRRRARIAVREADLPERQKRTAKTGSVAAKLSAEVEALREQLFAERAKTAELETRVDEDPLTGLLNRRGFTKAFERTLAYVKRYKASAALLYLDLDGFKPVNDKYGHAAGDWVLGRVGRLIAGSVRASDVVARMGGDEFAILLWNLDERQAFIKARSLEDLISQSPFEWKGKRYAIGLSVGVAMLSGEETGESVITRADAAMYARKKERKASA